MYNITWTSFITRLLPWFLRKPILSDWIRALLQPVTELHQAFLSWNDSVIYRLHITGQVIYLEMMLNDQFNGGTAAWTFDTTDYTYTPNTSGGIYIIDFSSFIPDFFVYNDAEAPTPPYIYNDGEGTVDWYLYNDEEYDTQPDFVVMVPVAVGDVTDPVFKARMSAWINRYKQAGARFTLTNY